MFQRLTGRIPYLSIQIFLLIVLVTILPMYGVFTYLRMDFERYVQREISDYVIQNISKSEQEIYGSLKDMAGISSLIATNDGFAVALMDGEADYYQKTKVFDSVVATISTNNMFTMGDVKLTVLDEDGRVYSNWSANYNDYQFLLALDWVQESIAQKGHITWAMFSPGFIIDPNTSTGPEEGGETYISLARSMLSGGITGEYIGTIIVSIEQQQFGDLLAKYAYNENDRIYICVDEGKILMHLTPGDLGEDEMQIRQIFNRMQGESGSQLADLDGRKYLASYYTIPSPWTFNNQQLRVLHLTDYHGVIRQVELSSRRMQWIMAAFLLVLTAVAGVISVRIVRPVKLLAEQMRSYTIQSRPEPLNVERRDEIGSLNQAFHKMSGYITDLFGKLNHEYEVRERYRFESLRAQINPHFLFNTLNSIRWMAIIRGADNMVENIDALAEMLKYSMNRGGELVTLEEELQNVSSYVFIQNTRYGDRCQLEVDLEAELRELYVVKFILQPIVENAVLHGVKQKETAGRIRIYGHLEEKALLLFVEDNGQGIPPDILEQLQEQKSAGHVTGIGIDNVHERIRLGYGDPFGLSVESQPGKYTVVRYTLPVIRHGEEAAEEEVET